MILAAGALNTTEILLRSEARGLSVSPALGSPFSANGDFFGLGYNGCYPTDVLGYGALRVPHIGDSVPPGPTVVAIVNSAPDGAEERRIDVADVLVPE